MIRVILYVLLIFALAAGFAWLADNPGAVTLSFQEFDVRTTVMAAAVFLVAIVVVGRLIWLLLRGLIRAPGRISRQVVERRRELGHNALTQGFIAVGSGDANLASFYAAEARYYAQNDPMTLMLTAQTAQLSGDEMAARAAYETMLAKAETRVLGLRGLFLEARRRGDRDAARSFAEAADHEKPGLGWAGSALLEYQAADGEWAAALTTLENLAAGGAIDSDRNTRLQAVLRTARTMELEDSEPETARDLAFEAHKHVPGLVPAAVLAARLATRLGDQKRAARIIETTWKIEPHPDLAAAYLDVRPGESGRERMRRMGQLTKIRANHREGRLAMARAAIDAQDWPAAREELRGLIATEPSERVYLMMAEIEDGEHGDIGRARDWFSRAVRAPRDPAWVADGYIFDHWEPVSPISGQLDAFEWKVPAARLPGVDDIEPIDTELNLPAVIDVEPPPEKPTSTDDKPAEPDQPVAKEAKPAADERPAMPPQPDDPGPEPETDTEPRATNGAEPGKGKRFRLFQN